MKQTDYRKKNNRSKLNMAMIALVVSLVVLIMAAFAWYTLSTNPEIKGMSFRVNAEQAVLVSQDGKSFSNSEDLSKQFKNVGALVPSSTVDGLNWFVCKYDMNGNVLQDQDNTFGTQFQYLRFPNGGNEGVKTDGTSGDGTATQADTDGTAVQEQQCYYIYTDIWLKTEQDQAKVYLSIPNNASDYKQDNTENSHYGSYVMSYHVNETEDASGKKTKQIQLTEGGSETSARVGFLVMQQGTDGAQANENPEYTDVTTNNFYIYEPNADRRSEVDKSSGDYDADQYVAGFTARDYSISTGSNSIQYGNANGYYIPTYPIAVRENDVADNASSYNRIGTALGSITDKSKYEEIVKNWNSNGQGADGNYKGYDGTISVFPADHLLAQKSSTWKRENEKSSTQNNEITTQKFNSTMIGSMGAFLPILNNVYPTTATLKNTNADYGTALDTTNTVCNLRSSVPLVTLTRNKPVKVRLYFWLEGQDVDCWNDIADTDFLVNLEFVGDVDATASGN